MNKPTNPTTPAVPLSIGGVFVAMVEPIKSEDHNLAVFNVVEKPTPADWESEYFSIESPDGSITINTEVDKTIYGWICPRCQRVRSPYEKGCDCEK